MENSLFDDIKNRFQQMPIYKTKNNYEYFVYPYKGITPINNKEIEYLAKIISSKISKDTDAIFTVETDGIFIALPVAMTLERPLIVARSFDYKMKKCFHFTQKTGYHQKELFFHFDLKKYKKIVIIDCVLSTGGTLKAIINLFKELNLEIEGIYVILNKINYSDENFINEIKSYFFSIFDIEIKNKHLIIEKSKYYK